MTGVTTSLKSAAPQPSSPMRRLFVLVQVQPHLKILATSTDQARLDRERDKLLGMPWDQDLDGARELQILPAIHLPAATYDRRRLQRQNRFR